MVEDATITKRRKIQQVEQLLATAIEIEIEKTIAATRREEEEEDDDDEEEVLPRCSCRSMKENEPTIMEVFDIFYDEYGGSGKGGGNGNVSWALNLLSESIFDSGRWGCCRGRM